MSRVNWPSKRLIPSSLIRNSNNCWMTIFIIHWNSENSIPRRIRFKWNFIYLFIAYHILCENIWKEFCFCGNFQRAFVYKWAYGGYVGMKHIQYSVWTLHRLNGYIWKLPIKRNKMDFKVLALFLMVLVAFVAAKKPIPPCTFRLFSFQSILF